MTDKDVIQQFYKQISWADQCREVLEGNRTLLVTPCAICIPTHWQDFEQNKAFIITIALKYSLSPKLLVWGEPSDYETEKIWWDVMTSSNPRVYAKFIDVQASVLDAQLLLKTFEGADIPQTLANFLAGKPEVVWTWDKNKISPAKCNICNDKGHLPRSLYVQKFPDRESHIPVEALYVACDCSLDEEDEEE